MPITLDSDDLTATQTSLGLTKGVANGNVIAADATGIPAINGSQVTALNAAALTGSIADARLPAAIQGFPAPGTSGNTLQSDGTNWTSAAAGGGGGLEFIGTAVSSGSSTDLIVTGLTNNFDSYRIVGSQLGSSSAFNAKFVVGNASGFIIGTGGSGWQGFYDEHKGGIARANPVAMGDRAVEQGNGGQTGTGQNNVLNFVYNLFRTDSTRKGPTIIGYYFHRLNSNQPVGGFAMASHAQIDDDITRVRLTPTSGNWVSGSRLTVHGVKHS